MHVLEVEKQIPPNPENGVVEVPVFPGDLARNHSSRAQVAVATADKFSLISCARVWAAAALWGARGARVVSADQAPHRTRSMHDREINIFNGDLFS